MSTLKRTQLTQSTPSIVAGAREENDGGLTRSGYRRKRDDVSRGGRGRRSLGESERDGGVTGNDAYHRTQQVNLFTVGNLKSV